MKMVPSRDSLERGVGERPEAVPVDGASANALAIDSDGAALKAGYARSELPIRSKIFWRPLEAVRGKRHDEFVSGRNWAHN